MKQLALACHNYESTFGVFPIGHQYIGHFDGNTGNADGGTGFAWGAYILPYIDGANIANIFNYDYPLSGFQQPANEVNNSEIAVTPMSTYRCPSDIGPPTFNQRGFEQALSNYAGNAGSFYNSLGVRVDAGAGGQRLRNGILMRDSGTKFRDIEDGTSNTVLIGEQTFRIKSQDAEQVPGTAAEVTFAFGSVHPNGWAQGGTSFILMTGVYPINQPPLPNTWGPSQTSASSLHEGGAQFAFADGSVHSSARTSNTLVVPVATMVDGGVVCGLVTIQRTSMITQTMEPTTVSTSGCFQLLMDCPQVNFSR